MRVVETDPLAREPVEHGRPQGLVRAEGIIDTRIAAPVVGEEEENIGSLLLSSVGHRPTPRGHPRNRQRRPFQEASARQRSLL